MAQQVVGVVVYDQYYVINGQQRPFQGFHDWQNPNTPHHWIGQVYGPNAEALVPPITGQDGIYIPPAQLPHGVFTSTLPNESAPVQSTAQYQQLPMGQRLLVSSNCQGWPGGYYSVTKMM